jgi:hypothetical protein
MTVKTWEFGEYTFARLYDPGTDGKYAVILNHIDNENGIAWVRFCGNDGKVLFGTDERMVPTTYLREF